MASFMEQIRGGRAKFNPDRVVLTAGATAANELLTFILANPGDALLVPTPYYPGSEIVLIPTSFFLSFTYTNYHTYSTLTLKTDPVRNALVCSGDHVMSLYEY